MDPFVALSGVDERVRRTRLESGVRVVSDPTPGAASAAVSIWIGAGSRDEPAELAGAFHFLEHLLFKGTARRSAHDLNMAIDSVGGELNAFTSKESTAFFARVPASDAAMAVDLLAEMVSEHQRIRVFSMRSLINSGMISAEADPVPTPTANGGKSQVVATDTAYASSDTVSVNHTCCQSRYLSNDATSTPTSSTWPGTSPSS